MHLLLAGERSLEYEKVVFRPAGLDTVDPQLFHGRSSSAGLELNGRQQTAEAELGACTSSSREK